MSDAVKSLGRSYWVLSAVLGYACLEAARSGGGGLPWLALVVLPCGLAEVFRRTRSLPGTDRFSQEARIAVRATFWGAMLLVAARTGDAARPALDTAANLGAGAAAVGALVALARLPAVGGLLEAPGAARSLDAAVFVGFLWGLTTAVPAAHVLVQSSSLRLDPLVIDYATTSAGIGTLLVMVAATLRLRWLRRLELGIGDRSRAAFALCVVAFSVGVPAAWLDVAPPDRVLPAAVAVASAACAWAAAAREAALVTRLLRGLLALTLLGAPLVIGATLLAQLAPSYAPAIVLTSSLIAIAVGLLAHAAARPLGPEQSRWLIALDQAARDALQPEPNAALRAALVALGRTCRTPDARPELWQRDPPEVLSVDVAGYLHVVRAEAPAGIYELGQREPERTLRTDVLRALEVRRPEIRGLLAWLEARRAFSATIVVDEEGPIGFVLLPESGRTSPLTQEEACAARLLSDRISSLLAVSSALSRSRQRELSSVARADALGDECRRLEHIIEGESERHRRAAERLARPARACAFSSAARDTLSRLEQLARSGRFLALVSPPGCDPLGWAAHFHLAGSRAGGPFIVVDAASAAQAVPEHFDDPKRSPLALADGGTLLVTALIALPLATQDVFAIALSERPAYAPQSSILPPTVVVALPQALDALVKSGSMSSNLARWFRDAEVRLPALSERPEDLRALALDALARKCLELGRPPLGLDPGALRWILEHAFLDNEAELRSILGQAAAKARDGALTASDLEATEPSSSAASPGPEPSAPPPSLPRRRASRRPPRGR